MTSRLERAVGELLDGEAVHGASRLQLRGANAKTGLIVGAVCGFMVATSVLDGGAALVGALAGGGGALGQLPFIEPWIIARTDRDVVLCSSTKVMARPVAIEHRDVSISRSESGLASDTYASLLGPLVGSRLRRGEIDRIIDGH